MTAWAGLTVLEYAPSDLMNVAYLNPFIYIYYYRGTVSWSTVNMTCIDLCTIYNRFTFCWIYFNADAAELYDIYLHTSHGCDPVRIFWRINNAVRADNSYFKDVFRIKHKIMDWNHGTAYLKLYNKCILVYCKVETLRLFCFKTFLK